ncbi:hypothetical protein MRB53_001366 [Persea americana]|uniref:Uncharacterized protein n=1 Tax=Persea americana TaxID=3435 RepID=A0ACC2MSH6_PERAE|nr:hypothetical protein MRB53_001366 [Persea americana]
MKRKRGGKKCTINGGVQLSLNSSGSQHISEVFRQAALVISTPDLVELQSVAISGGGCGKNNKYRMASCNYDQAFYQKKKLCSIRMLSCTSHVNRH